MQLEWTIRKKRGNHRPVLQYEIELEPFEVELAVPQVVLEEAVVKPPSAWRSYCYPGMDERAGAPLGWYRLMTPSHKSERCGEKLILPWRAADAVYHDVEAAFNRLRHDFELALGSAHNSAPVDLVARLELTAQTRREIAAGVASARFLAAAGF